MKSIEIVLLPVIAELRLFVENDDKSEGANSAAQVSDINELVADFEKLAHLLAEHNTKAGASLTDIVQKIPNGEGLQPELQQLKKHINGYDYKNALSELDALVEKMWFC